jgi:predicted AlkP superfamily pyrophosphatase or phosphodiesterase
VKARAATDAPGVDSAMRRVVLVLLLLVAAAGCATPPPAPGGELKPTVIVISFDGWRWDYHTRAAAPNLQRLIARGVHAQSLIPSFPPKTFPNHYTIVTGLYPGRHGIVANAMFDAETGRTFTNRQVDELRDPMWWGGEPIWVTAERAGQPSATMFWVGSEAPIGGVRPRYWKPYDESYPATGRVDQILQWLDLPAAQRPTFIAGYFSDVDEAGHAAGPDSEAVRNAVARADGYLGRLVEGLERRGLADRINIVVVSDHGMAAVSTERVVVLDDYISLDDVVISDINPTVGLFPKAGKEDAVYRALVNAHPRLRVYRRNETPEAWHYRDHPRIPPIIGVVDEGWQIIRRTTLVSILERRISPAGGQHGYDPGLMSMHGVFVAAGPAFRQGATVPAFENVHIYNVLSRVLGVTPAANDGDPSVAESLLR